MGFPVSITAFIGMTGKNGPAGFWPMPLVSDSSVTATATMAQIAAAAVATMTTLNAVKIARKQHSIAKAHLKMAEDKWARFKQYYMPCERKEMAEACNTPIYKPEYEKSSADYMNYSNIAWKKAKDSAVRKMNAMCLTIDRSLLGDIELAESLSRLDGGNFAMRYEEARKEAKDDSRWNFRGQALNRGRDLQSMAFKYSEAASSAYGQLGKMNASTAQGAISALGYFGARKETTYPSNSPYVRAEGGIRGFSSQAVVNNNTESYTNKTNPILGYRSPLINEWSNSNSIHSSPDAIVSAIGGQSIAGTGA